MTRIYSTIADRYLADLKAALVGLDADLARDIYDGIAEELAGIDESRARTRIADLGSAVTVAAAAGGNVTSKRLIERPGFALVSSLVYGFGWLVFPGVGWVVGVVLVWLSTSWTSRQKWSALGAPLAIGALVGGIIAVLFWVTSIANSPVAMWNVLGGGGFAGGVTSLVAGMRMCALQIRSQRAHNLITTAQ